MRFFNQKLDDKFDQALSQPMPCDTCKQFNRCKTEAIACEDWVQFCRTGVNQSVNRRPSKRWFRIAGDDRRILPEDRRQAIQIALTKSIELAEATTGICQATILYYIKKELQQ